MFNESFVFTLVFFTNQFLSKYSQTFISKQVSSETVF